VKNVPKVKNPYGSLGPSPATVKKVTPPAYNASASLGGWGGATQANNLNTVPGNTLKYDVPGVGGNPAAPYVPPTTAVKPATPGHWNTTDWAAMIPGDWEVTDAEAQGNKMQGEAEAAFQKQLRQAFIDYGGDSSKLGDYSKYIDDPTIQAAQNNKFSQTAQNLAAMTKSLANTNAQLAARGMGRSGKSTEVARQALEAKELADYTGLRSFLGGADEGTAGLAQTRQSIADRITAARSSAAARLAAQYPNTWEEGTPESTYDVPGSGGTIPAVPTAAAPPKAGSVLWNGTQMNASQLAAELARTGVNRSVWIGKHPGAAATLGWA
jgi:hypothetical protein